MSDDRNRPLSSTTTTSQSVTTAKFRRPAIDKNKTIPRQKKGDDQLPGKPPRSEATKQWRRLNNTVQAALAFTGCYRRDSLSTLPLASYRGDEDSDDELAGTRKPAFNNAETSRIVYITACKKYDVVASSTFLKAVDTGVANLNYQGLEPLGTRAVAMALVSNLTITELSIRGNAIGTEGLQCIVEMLKDNCALKSLDISDNDLQTEGAKLVARILTENEVLTTLSISGNKFKENDATYIAEALKSNTTLKSLDLSYNEFGEIGGSIIGDGLADNDALTGVNLSWNHLRLTGIGGMAKGLQENGSIRTLDLSWNGLGDLGAKSLGEMLKENTTLKYLDLSSCRIGLDGVGFLMTEMCGNETLKSINLSKNPITSHGACAFLQVLKNHPSFAIDKLDIHDICITTEFLELLAEVQRQRPDLEVKHGGTLRGKDAFIHRVSKPDTMEDPFDVLLKYVKEKGLRLMDLFQQFDKDKNCGISKEEFIKGIKEANLPLNLYHVEKLLDRLDLDRNGVVDFGELLDGRHSHLLRKKRNLLNKAQDSLSPPHADTPANKSPKSNRKWSMIIKFSGMLGIPDVPILKSDDGQNVTSVVEDTTHIDIPV